MDNMDITDAQDQHPLAGQKRLVPAFPFLSIQSNSSIQSITRLERLPANQE